MLDQIQRTIVTVQATVKYNLNILNYCSLKMSFMLKSLCIGYINACLSNLVKPNIV